MSRLASRHTYRPPKSNRPLNIAAAIIGGIVFTFLIFYLIPLMQKLEGEKENTTTTLEIAQIEDAPEEFEVEEEIPPPEEEPEPEPELQLETDPMEIADIPFDVGLGVGGKMMLDLKPNFEVANDPNGLMGSDLDTPPRPTSKPPPRYPKALLQRKQGGRVIVMVTVSEEGSVTSASVRESSGFPAMDQAALAAAYRQAYLLNPEESQWRTGLTLSLYQQEKWAESAAMLEDLLAANPQAADFWKMQANCYLNLEQPLRAAENFEIIRLKGLADATTLNTLGDIYTDQKKPLLALGAFLAAIEQDSTFRAERNLRSARVLVDYGAPREASRLIDYLKTEKRAELEAEQLVELLLIEIKIVKEGGDLAKTGQLLKEILVLQPMNGGALVENGIYLEQLADEAAEEEDILRLRGAARAQFKLAMKSEQQETQYLANRSFGQMLVRQRDFAEALPYLERAEELRPSEGLARYVKQVSVFAERQQESRAREEAQRAVLREEMEKKQEEKGDTNE